MTISEETLMAYADGELDPAQREAVQAAIAADPQLARRVELHQALRKKLGSEFDPVLLETVPDALIAAIRSSPATTPGSSESRQGPTPREATVTDLRRVRAARAAEAKEAAASARRAGAPRRPWTWVEWSAMAASVATGAIIALLALKAPDANRITTDRGQIVARADLADALSNQLVSSQSPSSPVQIGLSFKSKSGEICRTFTVKEQTLIGGLACRQGDAWHVEVLASQQPGRAGDRGYKPARGSTPAAVLAAVEQRMSGEALDAVGESEARAKGWK